MLQSGFLRSISTSVTPGILGPLRDNCNLGTSRSGVGLSVLGLASLVASLLEGKVMSKSLVWLTLVRPGLGSKAGINAENLRLMTCSSSQVLRLEVKVEVVLRGSEVADSSSKFSS